MKIKRYFAPDIKQAIRMVREEQGPDAVILSNRKVDGGVEIVAARDFDEQALPDRGQPEGQAAPQPQEPTPDRAAAEAKRRAEEVFRETLGRAQEAARPAEPPRRPEPMKPREPAPAPASKAAPWAEALGYRDAPQRPAERQDRITEPVWPRITTPDRWNAGLNGEPEQDAPRRAERPAAARPEERRRPPAEEPRRYEDRARRPNAAEAQRPAAAPREAAPNDTGIVLKALHKEMQQMRRALDHHLGESRWHDDASVSPARLDLLRNLGELGFSKRISMDLAERAGLDEDFDTAWNRCQDALARRIPMVDDGLLEYGGVVALVGPTGVGKTTTVAKLAARFRMKHGSRQVALITTDNYRIGAQEQLATYGRILDVPVRGAASIDELRHHLSGFYDRRLVLIDTAGMGPRDLRLAEQMALFGRSELPVRSYLVLSAASQYRAMREAIEAFAGFAPEACVLTKLDETAQLGTALSALIEHRLPAAFLCDGQQVPEDLHQARPQWLMDRCFSAENEGADSYTRSPMTYEDWVSHANF